MIHGDPDLMMELARQRMKELSESMRFSRLASTNVRRRLRRRRPKASR